ncbi:hypothetical protein KAT24_02060 [Candidatus Pacearchaeota archaeon]|nr:hypothetical protein [Candidatus Pacearchaeota archaeon]
MKYKLGLILVCLVLVNLSFVSAETTVIMESTSQLPVDNWDIGDSVVVEIQEDYCLDGGALFNKSQICYDSPDKEIYAQDIPYLHNIFKILMVMISEENRLRVEVNEIRKELDETKKELSELKKVVETMSNFSTESNEQILTGAVIEDLENQDGEEDKGILGFFKRLFGKRDT